MSLAISIAFAKNPTMIFTYSSFMPLEVIAGVPILTAPGFMGDLSP